MKIKLNEDYYFWCCDWCDSENLVLWAKLQEETYCGACHRPMDLTGTHGVAIDTQSFSRVVSGTRRTSDVERRIHRSANNQNL